MTCPSCKEEVSIDDVTLKIVSRGYKGKCPLCKKYMVLNVPSKGYVRGKNGELRRPQKTVGRND